MQVITKVFLIVSVFFTGFIGMSPLWAKWPRPELAPGAENIVILKSTKEAAGCKRVGVATGQVLSRISGIKRNSKIVKNDIYVKAKNSTLFQGGDTMVPVGKIEGGMQNFIAYKCNKP